MLYNFLSGSWVMLYSMVYSVYLNRKATVWYLRFLPVHSPDSIDDTKKARDAEGPKEEDAGYADDADVSRPMLLDDEDEDESDGGGEE